MPDETTADVVDTDAIAEEIEKLLEADGVEVALERLRGLHPADQADVISELEPDQLEALLPGIPSETLADILGYLREEPRRDIVAAIDPRVLGPLLDDVDRDVAVDILHTLPEDRATATLASMARAGEIAPLLPYADESAGGRMTSDFVALQKEWTVEETINFMRRMKPDAEQVYYLYAVDRDMHLEGVVSLRHLVIADPKQRIGEIMTPEVVTAHVGEDQEELARRLQRYNFIALPVVDEQNRLVGVVSFDDLMDVAEEEATEDMYRMIGLGVQETVFSPVRVAARRRIPWLLVNLATAFLSALTVSAFEDTIARVAALAAFMPVIAGHGGNTGTQAITLVVRGLALDEVRPADALQVMWKEIRFGAVHGSLAGALSSSLAWVLTGNEWLALVVFCAMLGNVIVAAVIGSLLPLVMRRFGIDPALASAIWLTTFTDVVGFLLLLGLGALLVGQLS